jgi:hypothetical protein
LHKDFKLKANSNAVTLLHLGDKGNRVLIGEVDKHMHTRQFFFPPILILLIPFLGEGVYMEKMDNEMH